MTTALIPEYANIEAIMASNDEALLTIGMITRSVAHGPFYTSMLANAEMLVHSAAKIYVVDTLLATAINFLKTHGENRPLKEALRNDSKATFWLRFPEAKWPFPVAAILSQPVSFSVDVADLFRSEGGTKVFIIDRLLEQADKICHEARARQSA